MFFHEITLSGTYREIDYQVRSLLRTSRRSDFCFSTFFRTVSAIAGDRKAGRVLVVVKPDFRFPLYAGLQEVRTQLGRLKEARKEIWIYSPHYTDETLYLASVCDHRVIHPLGDLRCTGLARPGLFFRRLLDDQRVQLQVQRRGKYKSAMDRFLLERMDSHNREQYARWLGVAAEHIHQEILDGYGKNNEALQTLLDGAVLTSRKALQAGWVSEVRSLSSLRREWREEKHRKRRVRIRRVRGKRVAVLVFEGAIKEGRSEYSPLLGQTIGSESFVRHVEALRKDRRVRAVVLRINSGGGSAVASEEIRDSLADLAKKKTMLVSMGDLAGSGGYWISATGARISAAETTLTGSIGVISAEVFIAGMLGKYGVTHETIATHPHADASLGYRLLDERELESAEGVVESIYGEFLTLVAHARNMPREQVDDIAQGRVWSGLDAVENGLVDELALLGDSIAAAAWTAGVAPTKVEFYPKSRRSFLERVLSRNVRIGVGLATPFARAVLPAGALGGSGIIPPFWFPVDRVFRPGTPLALEPETVLGILSDPWESDILNTDLQPE